MTWTSRLTGIPLLPDPRSYLSLLTTLLCIPLLLIYLIQTHCQDICLADRICQAICPRDDETPVEDRSLCKRNNTYIIDPGDFWRWGPKQARQIRGPDGTFLHIPEYGYVHDSRSYWTSKELIDKKRELRDMQWINETDRKMDDSDVDFIGSTIDYEKNTSYTHGDDYANGFSVVDMGISVDCEDDTGIRVPCHEENVDFVMTKNNQPRWLTLDGRRYCDDHCPLHGYCWPYTPPGSQFIQACHRPSNKIHESLYHGHAPGFIGRVCLPNGTWADPDTSACEEALEREITIDATVIHQMRKIKLIYTIGNAVSFIVLLGCLITFLAMKRLRSIVRNWLHIQLFIAFMLRDVSNFVQDYNYLRDPDKLTSLAGTGGLPQSVCRAATIAHHYFEFCGLSWIFVEAYYLNNVILQVELYDSKDFIYPVSIFGWVPGMLSSVFYLLLRKDRDNDPCWRDDQQFYWHYMQWPRVVLTALNLLMFVHIFTVVAQKLKRPPSVYEMRHSSQRVSGQDLPKEKKPSHDQSKSQNKKLARAILFLVPLFGLHDLFFHFLFPYRRVKTTTTMGFMWNIASRLITAFQGCAVAVVYFLINKDTKREVKNRVRRWSAASSVYSSRNNLSTLIVDQNVNHGLMESTFMVKSNSSQ